jgi:hypothetical protein
MSKDSKNYLDKIPKRSEKISWSDYNNKVTLEIENKGIFNRIAQKIFRKPRISYVHLDEMGGFIWTVIDGEKSILELGKIVEEKFGEEASPLYERLSKYCRILESYGFISWVEK